MRNENHDSIMQVTNQYDRQTRDRIWFDHLHGFTVEGVLDVGDHPSRVKELGSTREDSKSLLRGVQHLLDVGKHACGVR